MRKLSVAAVLFYASMAMAFCYEQAGREYGVDPLLLQAIASVESNFQKDAVQTTDGITYRGLMQISSFHMGKLRTRLVDEGKLFEPCLNVRVGAWVLRDAINTFGERWRAVGAYGAGFGAKQEIARHKYALKVKNALMKMQAKQSEDVQVKR